ncbi:DUF11 domain-containing protein [Sphingomonas rubra]|uniref:Conserved repeat domain-containing protein n=1 Tax=Sphingomonas rubra TaxID=634430 RepID=A0A1I5TWH0_9SPHN|nr:DUF11 domain-containing protein [Sphingomonas rubra]SFP87241.1 conserved repeat domain-containing protein [Sphingomonas rubra]
MPRIRPLRWLLAALLSLAAAGVAGETVRVANTGVLRFADGTGAWAEVRSNTVALDVEQAKRPTTLAFYRPPDDYELTGMRCRTTPALAFTPAPVDEEAFARATKVAALDIYADMLLALDNPAGNRDPLVRETATITATVDDVAVALDLLETGADSGTFVGGVPATATGKHPDLVPCDVRGQRGGRLSLSFGGDASSLGSAATLLIDPAGFVFDSGSGALIDGAIVSLVDANGEPAIVYGDDGVSRYPSTVTSGAAVTDAGGRFYPALPGRYRFPYTLPGTYFLKVEPPGDYTAPSVVPLATLERLAHPGGAPFILNDASFGRALVLSSPDPFYADIPLDRPDGAPLPATGASLLLTKTASVREASPGDVVQYRLQLANRGTGEARALHVLDTLPSGLRYRRGSARGAAEPAVAADGRSLDFPIDPLGPAATREITYAVEIAPGAPVGEALNRARVTGEGVASNEAAASVRVQALLFSDALTVIGRVTGGDCGDPVDRRRGIPGVRLMLEDGSFVVTDRNGLYHFEGVPAGRHVVQLDTGSLPATHAPVACDADTRSAGSAISRFVEGQGGLLKRVDFQLRPTGKAPLAVDALPIAVADDATAAGNRDWTAGLVAGPADWLFPAADHNPRSAVQRVVVRHPAGTRVALRINGRRTDPLAFDGSEPAGEVAVSRWTGVPLGPGDNRLEADILGSDGRVVTQLSRIVHQAGAGVRATVDLAKSRLVADGLTRPLIAVRVVDAAGRPARAGTPVPFRVDQPYRAAAEVAVEQQRPLAGRGRTDPVAQVVGDDGYAFLALAPTTQGGAVRGVVRLADGEAVRASAFRAWLEAPARAWQVVGFGAGSIGYDTLRTRARSLPRGRRGEVVTDGQLALYAKGRIRGLWLLTLAYDSDGRYDPRRGLLGTIDPDRYYTVYGDGTVQGYDAPTRRKLYLRLERREFYALFGDFESGFTDTQLTRFNRTLNGVKAAYQGQGLSAAAFAAKVDTRYARDEIQGNGLSGPYRLGGRDIVPNSDKLRLETRDRFRSERIVATRQLTRHIDYDIDTRLGTVRFREPVLARDLRLNPQFIVAEYEVETGRAGKLAAAARVAGRTGGLELGASVIRDETAGAATVVGADLRATLAGGTELRGELATGGRMGLADGIAFLAEAEHHGAGVDLLLYARQQDEAFGVGQQNLVEAGTRKLGLDTRVALGRRWSLTGTGWYQRQLSGTGERLAGEGRLEYRRDAGTVFAGVQGAADRGLDGRDRRSLLATLGGSRQLGEALTLSAQTQVALGGKASVDFPARHQLNAAWRVRPGIRLLAGYEIAQGRDFTTDTAQIGFDLAPWTGAKLFSTLNQQAADGGGGENGARTFAQYGLSQSLPIGKRWSIDATLDASSTVRGRIPVAGGINAFQPVASGGFLGQDQVNGDYLAVTMGASYRGTRWSWNGRLERRDADREDRWGITSNLLRTLGEGRTLASGLRAYAVTAQGGARATYASADVALALRPPGSRWSVLERVELRHEHADGAITGANPLGVPAYNGADQVTSRAVNNLAVNYRSGAEGAGHATEATVYYGAKYVRGRFADDVYAGFVDVTGFELRQDAGRRVDIGVQASVQHAWDANGRGRGAWAWSGGPSLGVSPGGNTWISVGYNVAGYRDRDFEADRYTRSGPYVTMRVKFDQSLLRLGRQGR